MPGYQGGGYGGSGWMNGRQLLGVSPYSQTDYPYPETPYQGGPKNNSPFDLTGVTRADLSGLSGYAGGGGPKTGPDGRPVPPGGRPQPPGSGGIPGRRTDAAGTSSTQSGQWGGVPSGPGWQGTGVGPARGHPEAPYEHSRGGIDPYGIMAPQAGYGSRYGQSNPMQQWMQQMQQYGYGMPYGQQAMAYPGQPQQQQQPYFGLPYKGIGAY